MTVPDGMFNVRGDRYWTTSDASETAAEEVVHLTRATYRLPADLANPFSVFLNNTLGNVVQSSVQVTQAPSATPGENSQVVSRIVVTADEETQKVVGHFIGLLRTHGKLGPGVTPVASLGSAAVLPWVDPSVKKAEAVSIDYPVQATYEVEKPKPVDPTFARPARTLPEPPRE